MYSQFLIKKTSPSLFRKLQKNKRKVNKKTKQQSKSPNTPLGTWPCDRKQSCAEPPMQMPTEPAKKQMPWAAT